MKNFTLKQKISQMFISGFEGTKPDRYFKEFVKSGLGGAIFFTHNIENGSQIKNLISSIKKEAAIPMFFSIDQEGGRVERTENIHNGKKYLSAKYAYEKGLSFLQNQTKEIALELKSYGINMNFAPVLDVNTCLKNPIIGERAFSCKTNEVIEASKIVIKEYEKYNIVTVGKHFPGHGASDKDSHKALPVINLSVNELREIHIKPFVEAIKQGLPAIMAAHVLYPELDNVNPASVSYEIINNMLIKEIGFTGLIITDDMEMNGIKGFTRLEACKRAINAGVNMFIFRDTTEQILQLVDDIKEAVLKNEIDEQKIDTSFTRICNIKKQYKI